MGLRGRNTVGIFRTEATREWNKKILQDNIDKV